MQALFFLILLKVAYLTCGIILCLIGNNLIRKGIETKFEGEGSFAKNSIRIVTTSPGLVFLVAGLIVIGTTIFQKTKIEEAYQFAVNQNNLNSTFPDKQKQLDSWQKYVVRTKKISFSGDNYRTQFAGRELQTATQFLEDNKVDHAMIYASSAFFYSTRTIRDSCGRFYIFTYP